MDSRTSPFKITTEDVNYDVEGKHSALKICSDEVFRTTKVSIYSILGFKPCDLRNSNLPLINSNTGPTL